MKRVLFVDDEPAVLEALRQLLYRARLTWQMRFVSSGALALAELENESFDVIVSDMRMPKMDGAQLLTIVSERWPQTIRIVLSGFSEQSNIMRLVPVAHQYLTKPCLPGRLEQVIQRCIQLHEVLHDARLRAVVGRIRQLPAIPRVYARLNKVLASEDATIADVADVVASDSGVVAKVLQVVNSAFFRLPRDITRIEHAVSYLGLNAIRNLTLSAEIFSQWPAPCSPGGLEPELLQTHTQTIAAAAYALSGRSPWADDALLAGLLHDIGHWILVQQCPNEMRQVLDVARAEGIPLHEGEVKVLGTSHAQIGAYLLGLWGLPYSIVEAVAFHHNPCCVQQSEFDMLAALTVAHTICDSALPALGSIPDPSAVNGAYLSSLRAPFDWSEAERRIAEIRELEPRHD
jgi:HD-like signal output (HDOD) protein/CheY-like chemotaxis protein